MAKPALRSLVLGFLHVARPTPDSFRGGYLLTSEYGRPIEFHYTSLVSVTPLQKALYGVELERSLYTDVLAKPMTDRQSTAPHIIVVDNPALLGLRCRIPAPVVAISPSGRTDVSMNAHTDHPEDLAAFEKVRNLTPTGFDWMEPFDRIASALAEITDPAMSMAG